MLNNIIEFKDFINSYQNALNSSLKTNESVKVYFTYENERLIVKIVGNSIYMVDTFQCTNQLYNEMINLLCTSLISSGVAMISYRVNENYIIKGKNIELISNIPQELSNKISTYFYNNRRTVQQKQATEFDKVTAFFKSYSTFLKRCIKKEYPSEIKISYKNGIYNITITNNNEIVFKNTIACSSIKAQFLDKIICENIIDENGVVLSSIVGNYLKIQTPKIHLTIPYNDKLHKFHEEALEKINEYVYSMPKQKIKSSNR